MGSYRPEGQRQTGRIKSYEGTASAGGAELRDVDSVLVSSFKPLGPALPETTILGQGPKVQGATGILDYLTSHPQRFSMTSPENPMY